MLKQEVRERTQKTNLFQLHFKDLKISI